PGVLDGTGWGFDEADGLPSESFLRRSSKSGAVLVPVSGGAAGVTERLRAGAFGAAAAGGDAATGIPSSPSSTHSAAGTTGGHVLRCPSRTSMCGGPEPLKSTAPPL